MVDAEGPSTFFKLLLARWHTAPKMVIYDNACNLHRFALLREPAYFKECKCIVDCVHWTGHKECHECYDSQTQRASCFGLNTQMCEQDNAKDLGPYRTQMRFMSQGMFQWHARLHAYVTEKKKLRRN